MQYRSVTVLAPAKLNLSLDVVGTLPNGYHDLDMVMQTIDLYEKITLRRSNDLSLTLPGSFVPVNDKNTAVKAALAFFDYTGLLAGVDMTIYKRVPVRAGMAGYRHPLPFDAYRTVKRGIGRDKHAAHLQRFQQPELQSCPGGHRLVFGHTGTYRIGSGRLSGTYRRGKTVIA